MVFSYKIGPEIKSTPTVYLSWRHQSHNELLTILFAGFRKIRCTFKTFSFSYSGTKVYLEFLILPAVADTSNMKSITLSFRPFDLCVCVHNPLLNCQPCSQAMLR